MTAKQKKKRPSGTTISEEQRRERGQIKVSVRCKIEDVDPIRQVGETRPQAMLRACRTVAALEESAQKRGKR